VRPPWGDAKQRSVPLLTLAPRELLLLLCATAPPSRDFSLVSEYVHQAVHEPSTPAAALALALRAWQLLKRVTKAGARRYAPSAEELAALRGGAQLSCLVYLLDGRVEEISFDPATSVLEAVEALAAQVGLHAHSSFSLFEQRRFAVEEEDEEDEPSTPEPELQLLEDSAYVCDALQRFRAAQAARPELQQVRLLFRKRSFRDQDDAVSEPAFLALCAAQALHDYLQGHYPVGQDDALQLAALGAVASGLEGDPGAQLEHLIPQAALAARPAADWAADLRARMAANPCSGRHEARCAVLRLVGALPYGHALFFPVRRIEDPIGLLPGRILLGINRRGVHFFRPVPKEYLYSAELRDIMQFGSSATAVFFKMRVAGALHVFQFDTKEGDDICVQLQTHINDIMMKRYQKQVATGKGTPGSAAGTPGPATPIAQAAPSADAALVADYERRVAEAAGQLAEAKRQLAAEGAAREAAVREKTEAEAALAEARAALQAGSDGSAQQAEGERVSSGSGSGTSSRSSGGAAAAPSAAARPTAPARAAAPGLAGAATAVTAARKLSAAGAAGAAARPAGAAAASSFSAQASPLLKEAQEKLRASERALAAATKERDALAGRLEKLEKAAAGDRDKGSAAAAKELADLKAKLDAAQQRLAHTTAQVEQLGTQLAAKTEEAAELEGQLGELEDLRELRADVARKDAQTAEIITRQRGAIEALEVKYREESSLRKRHFNTIEEMKGKVRVFARVRPLSSKEASEKQDVVLSYLDEFSLEHPWREGKEKRQYAFDAVFPPSASQESVFENVKYLVQSALDGYNVVVFAYGQTGSGKTFTVAGSEQEPGLTPRALRELCRLTTAAAARASVTLRASMLELYQDVLVDLLLPEARGMERPRLDIKKDAKGWVSVANATVREVSGYEQLMGVCQEGVARRKVANTQMNTESSRSHQVFSVVVESTDLQTQSVTKGKLSFVDLAGSERVKKSGASGEQLKEAQAINLSLSALGNVIAALASEQAHVPYRDHKLTMLMSDSLGGSAKTLMFVNASPTDGNLEETQSSLTYAQRVRTIKNDVTRNVATKELAALKAQVAFWRAKAGEAGPEELADIADVRDAPAAP